MLAALAVQPQRGHWSSPICPSCGQHAPIMLRGIEAQCTACGARRVHFTATAVNLAGKGTRIGGGVARFFGWASVVFGTSVAAFLFLIFQSIWPASFIGYAFALPILLISLAWGIMLIRTGGRLGKEG